MFIYRFTYGYHDGDSSYYFQHPNKELTSEQFQQITDSLLPQAITLALKNADSWIGIREIVDHIMTLLETQEGFQSVNLPTAAYWGANIILEENEKYLPASELTQLLIKHNQKIEADYQKQYLDSIANTTDFMP